MTFFRRKKEPRNMSNCSITNWKKRPTNREDQIWSQPWSSGQLTGMLTTNLDHTTSQDPLTIGQWFGPAIRTIQFFHFTFELFS